MRGFKSFASATTLRFEPGITAVVGPNGSGKSNVVDAIAWVLGEQGAKALRGGKMEDVIFAGTSGRAPLGRAEVSLTIDNADGALPIDYAEVSITRRMFRDGASEYEINGDSARLLDIQELLSDSGIGREMHVIVGQGQLDSVLQARPEDRRGFIEEAAGVLKHRKRKEKALRKLDGLQTNLTRLADLTAELRRQLKPLGRQAELARRAAGVQAELRDARLRLLADDLVTLRAQLTAEVADETALRQRQAGLERDLELAAESESSLEIALATGAPAAAEATRVHFEFVALTERLRGTQQLAAELTRHLGETVSDARVGRDPDELDAEADQAEAAERALADELARAQHQLAGVLATRTDAERDLAAAEQQLLAASRAAADRREGLATLAGRVSTQRARAAAGADEIARIAEAAGRARSRAAAAEAALSHAENEVGGFDRDAFVLDERHEIASERLSSLEQQVVELTDAIRHDERAMSSLTARSEALALGLARKDGAGAVLAAAELSGVLGAVSSLLAVNADYRTAVAAALATLADAVVVDSADGAVAVLRHLREVDGGRASLIIVDAAGPVASAEPNRDRDRPVLPPDCHWALDLFTADSRVQPVLVSLLRDVAVAPDLHAASDLVSRHPELRVVTSAGDTLGATWASGGSVVSPGAIEIQAELDEARQSLAELDASTRLSATDLAALRSQRDSARAEVETSLAELNSSDAEFNAVVQRLAELGQGARAAAAEADRLDVTRAAAESAREADLAGLAELSERLRLAEAEPVADEPAPHDRDAKAGVLAQARQAELDCRLAVRTTEERMGASAGHSQRLRDTARHERAARSAREAERLRRARGLLVARAVADAATQAMSSLERAAARAASERDELEAARASNSSALSAARVSTRELAAEAAKLTAAVHRDEVARAEQQLRISQIEAKAVDEHGIAPDALVAEYGPDQPVPPANAELSEYELLRERADAVLAPQPSPFDRPTLTRRANLAERDLAQLGKVNPLALEEFAALEERHQFLATQLEDLKNTRRDLLAVVKEVDDKIGEVFAAAYSDVAAQFETVFSSLFPGGEGRLLLTDPDDMLTTGIEIEARPPGKKVKRLSLLSGGERSLTAVALLVAIFRARPSPFYVMDEVEAALDDVNLSRLVGLIDELRASSQIIVITHQKRTMEVADSLYGVTMRGDGISQVISQRLREDGEKFRA